ncbi:related to protein histidine kinase [Cephalotrichum gorgonifer]|uniref:histidine kinase n=1 Tax=Cephalotrichum gorgonifer TaxID=2041049 RepID=A0AAE8SR37_9PEZI|nr:related to protein histidine kinase [Cephalotrichum gorgonifer]
MRIAIREQLVLLVTLAVLVALAVVALPTWFFVHRFVIQVRKESLALTASLKAAKITADLELVRSNCRTIASRILLQKGLNSWYASRIPDTWTDTTEDLAIALSARSQTGLLQARIYTRDGSGERNGIVNVTGRNIQKIRLPYNNPDGSAVYLGDNDNDPYSSALFPNITYENLGTTNKENNLTEWGAYTLGNISLTHPSGLLLGPLSINESFSLVSVTLPIWDNDVPTFALGFLTIVASAAKLIANAYSAEGLGDTGVLLLAGPDSPANRFNSTIQSLLSSPPPNENFENVDVHYLLPSIPKAGESRHMEGIYKTNHTGLFPLAKYPAIREALVNPPKTVNSAGAMLSTTNEQGADVAVGFARTDSSLVNWTVIVEQARKEAYEPINGLTKILLACVFGTAGAIFSLTYPCAHISVMPIRRLKSATEKTVAPPGYEDGYFDAHFEGGDGETPGSGTHSSQRSQVSNKGWFDNMLTTVGILPTPAPRPTTKTPADADLLPFKIPGKVKDRKHFITDELTELTKTFNDMRDELLKQYTVLDDKVAVRTRELEISKKAAEAANESKTLFIANISHELKTPLNGIMGLAAVCMEEDDVGKIKQSLRTLYKSGDLLLHLLEDLLSFSKNQIGQQLALEQKEFSLIDIRSQILTIFDKQVRESNINFSVLFLQVESVDLVSQVKNGVEFKIPAMGPQGTGRLKDMCLYGDQHRILQVIINLVSNSLKFTPKGGKVEVRIRCLGETDEAVGHHVSRSSSSSNPGSKSRKRLGSTSTHSAGTVAPQGTALAINPMEPMNATELKYPTRGRSPTPPPPNAKSFVFEFEVEDTGPGIPEAMQQQVFEPFVQGDWGLSKKFGGTGLGLSICQQLANLMGGNITLRSTVGVGSVFTMQIPLKYLKDRTPSTASSSIRSHKVDIDSGDSECKGKPSSTVRPNPESKAASVLDPQPRLVGLRQPFFASDRPAPQSTQAKLATVETALAAKKGHPGACARLRVLVADDNSTNIEVVSKMLKLEDVYDVTVAKDGQEAYEQVKAAMAADRGFDVIFMDVQMPNVDGLQSTRLIRGMGYKSPIVALTAFSEESNVRECMESGMDEFLSKPIRRPALKQVLQKFATIPEEPESAATTPGLENGALAVGGDDVTRVVENGGAPNQ